MGHNPKTSNGHEIAAARRSPGALRWSRLVLLVAGAALAAWGLGHPPRPEVRVTWATGSELDTAGFHVYRATTPEGPFTRVSPALLPAAPDPLAGGDHTFVDGDVAAGQTYYYELEDVETTGATERHGPTAVTAQAPPNGRLWLGLAALALGLAGLAPPRVRPEREVAGDRPLALP